MICRRMLALFLCSPLWFLMPTWGGDDPAPVDPPKLHVIVPPSLNGEKPSMILVVLHEEGGEEKQFADLFEPLADRLSALVVSVRGPVKLEEGGYAWYGENNDPGGMRSSLVTALRKIRKTFPVDARDIVVAGFSQGAVAALDLGLQYPGLFRGGVLCLSGKGYGYVFSSEDLKRCAAMGLRIAFLHGLKDEPREVRNTVRRLIDGGVESVLYEFGMGHALPPRFEAVLLKALKWLKGNGE